MPEDERRRVLRHALAYPFDPPGFSYRMHSQAGEAEEVSLAAFSVQDYRSGIAPLVDLEIVSSVNGCGYEYTNRVPVIAAGSNASFSRLKTKFSEVGLSADFPVLRARVAGLVPVYSAHVSKYGSIPGTLTGEVGAVSFLHIAFLDPAALRRINQSEALGLNYGLGLIEEARADFGDRHTLSSVCAYISKRGTFAPEGVGVRIDAFAVEKSALPSTGQRQILDHLHKIRAPDQTFEEFVHAHVDSKQGRIRSMEAMRANALPCSIPRMGWIEGEEGGRQASLPESFGN